MTECVMQKENAISQMEKDSTEKEMTLKQLTDTLAEQDQTIQKIEESLKIKRSLHPLKGTKETTRSLSPAHFVIKQRRNN